MGKRVTKTTKPSNYRLMTYGIPERTKLRFIESGEPTSDKRIYDLGIRGNLILRRTA